MSALRIVVVIVAAILLGIAVFSLAINNENTSGEMPDGQRPDDGEARAVIGDKKAEKATDSLKISVSLQSDKVTLEKPLNINLVVENTGTKPHDLTFNSGQKYDFTIIDEAGREVWRWSDGLMFTQAIITETIEPGERIEYVAEWTLTDSEGNKVEPGDYGVIAKVMANETKDVEVAADFFVEPESR